VLTFNQFICILSKKAIQIHESAQNQKKSQKNKQENKPQVGRKNKKLMFANSPIYRNDEVTLPSHTGV